MKHKMIPQLSQTDNFQGLSHKRQGMSATELRKKQRSGLVGNAPSLPEPGNDGALPSNPFPDIYFENCSNPAVLHSRGWSNAGGAWGNDSPGMICSEAS